MKKSDATIQWCRQAFSRLWEMLPQKSLKASDEPIDVVIPIISKDLAILPLCLQGVRKNICHPIKAIYIVAPNDPAIKAFCEKEHLVFHKSERMVFFGSVLHTREPYLMPFRRFIQPFRNL